MYLVKHLPRNFFVHGLRDESLDPLEAEAREEEEGEADTQEDRCEHGDE